jgi:sensor histidine kinase regulating citrate/malate metabolism
MNHTSKATRRLQRILAALSLIGVLFLTAGMSVACAARDLPKSSEPQMTQLPTELAQEPSQQKTLPDSVAEAVLQDASTQSNLPKKELRIVNAEPRNWSDGCLELAPTNTFCPQIVVSGWQVTVQGKQQRFVYRTNNSGSQVKLAREQ